MGLFDDMFRKKKTEVESHKKAGMWTPLETSDQLERLHELSVERPQLIFKHSTRCGISRMVMNLFRERYEFPENAADLHYLDIFNYRAISDEVARKYGIPHQSPQLLVIRNRDVIAHDSHGGINEMNLSTYL